MSIKNDVIELKSLDTELKRLRKRIRLLNEHKKRCEKRIIEYLEVNEQPGLKLDGMLVLTKDKKNRKYTNKNHKKLKGQHVLQKYGISDSSSALEELLEAMRGSPEISTTIKIV